MDHKQTFFFYTALIKLADTLTVIGVWFLCWYLRFTIGWLPITKGLPNYSEYSHVALYLGGVFLVAFHTIGAYRRDRIHFGFRAAKKLMEGSLIGTLLFVSACYFLRELDFSRFYLALFPFVVFPALLIERLLLEQIWKYVERRFIRPTRTLIVGSGPLLELYLEKLSERNPYPIQWVGRCGSPEISLSKSLPYLGTEARLTEIIDEENVQTVVVAFPNEDSAKYESVLQLLANEPAEVKVLPDFGKFNTFTYRGDQECGIPLLSFNELPVGSTDRALKRFFDIIFSILFLIFSFPLMALIALIVKLTSRGPVFYRQERMGADGKFFQIYKFRTMEIDAEKKTGAVWAVKDDPRTTRIGKLLRRTSLDEIPQFYNVLRGDMSVVGPRPERPVFVEKFRRDIPKYMLRHKMKSGITGWAQVNGWRGNTSLEERIKFDLYYIGHWSHVLDIKIICLTAWKGLVHRHAY